MVSQPPPTEVGLVLKRLEASSRAAQLEAEIAPLKNALARRATGRSDDRAAGPALSPSPQSGLVTTVRLAQNGHLKVRGIAQAMINAHCSRTHPSRGRNTQRDRECICPTAYA